jgi:hypothetical protein
MSAWSELEKAALLGTRRAVAQLPPIAPGIDDLLGRLDDADEAHNVLSAAGMLDVYEQIGRVPARLQPKDSRPPDPERRRVCPPEATYFLAQLLESRLRDLLPEFLGALRSAGYRLPETLLPNLLALGYTRPQVRALLLPVLGNSGRRLAAQHAQWHYAAVNSGQWTSVRRAWDKASDARRPTLISQLRATDPALGRALLESSWRAEKDQQRFRLIKALQVGLDQADEPLLETALDDRSRLVRRQAAELLARLPGSRLSQRVTAYVPLYLAWTPGETRRITVSLPEVTPAMRRDGVTGAAKAKPAHARSQEITQLVGSVPLAYWAATWGCAPRELLAAIPTTAWPRTLTAGFVLAATRQENSAWAEALIAQFGLTATTAKLIPILSPLEMRRLTRRVLADQGNHPLADREKRPLGYDHALLKIIRLWPGAWDAETALRVVELFDRHFRQTAGDKRASTAIRDRLFVIARRADPAILTQAEVIFSDLEALGCWRNTAREFLELLRFRQAMLAALDGHGIAAMSEQGDRREPQK